MDTEIKQMFELILQKLDSIDKRQDRMEERFDSMDKRLDGMGKRQDEIFSVVKSIEHSNNVRKAEIDNLTHKVAHVEGTISGIGEFIESRRAII